jgi:hypothetical protein
MRMTGFHMVTQPETDFEEAGLSAEVVSRFDFNPSLPTSRG